MPHKRNPGGCAVALAAASRVPGLVAALLGGMAQEHERGVGGWQGEAATIADTIRACGSALAAMATVVEGLTVHPDRMKRNLSETRGVVFAERAMAVLAPALGRERAQRAIAAAIDAAAAGRATFTEALRADADVAAALGASAGSLENPEQYLGSAEAFRRRLLGE